MRGGKITSGRKATFVPYVAVLVSLAVIVSLIVTSHGVEDRVMDLNNSGVWVTNDSRGLFGRVNRSAGVLDAAFIDPERESSNGHVDIFQDGEAVLGWSRDEGRLFPVDTRDATVAPGQPVGAGPLSAVAMAGGVMATISSDKGEVRTARYAPASVADVSGLAAGLPAVASLEVVSGLQAGVDVAVDSTGRVFAASASGAWVLIDGSGEASYGNVGESLRSVAVSLVGGVGVVADAVAGDVFLTTGIHAQVGTGVVPQQPGDGSRVVVASPSGLSSITVGDGSVSHLYSVPASGSGSSDSATGTKVVAEPVVLGSVVYGAWSGAPGHVVKVDSSEVYADTFPQDGSALSRPAFRVNRGSVVLNDMATGAVFDVDEKWSMDNWEDVAPEATQLSGDSSSSSEDSPQAKDDHVWARAGRMAVVHVLDNDDNPGTGIVSITAVSGPDASRVAISPDGQTLVADVAPDQSEDMSFTYTITNRAVNSEETDMESTANVTMSMRAMGEDSAPFQKSDQGKDDKTPDFTVPSGGFLTLAPAGSWRDPDSDPVAVISATVGGRVLPVTAQGLIQYTAPATPGQITETVEYLVSDGFGQTAAGEVHVQVMPDSAIQAIPPVAMSDSVRGVAGKPVVFYPLDNDVPGSDPLDKQAQLRLASPVGARVGMEVSTDLLSGAVTVSAERAGAYFLDYVVAFGAGFDAGKIRVDIVADDSVVAMPDTAVIRGTVPVVVDMVSNDRDPLGSVLTVVSATPRDMDRVRVGIIAGRWLQIDPQSSVSVSTASIIDYVVTNGLTFAQGQVSVTLLPGVGVDHVSVVDDIARVRVGDVTTIAVLDNDTSESGEPLVVNDNVTSMANAGQLRVEDPTAPTGQETIGVGRAFVDGNRVRYEAPASGEGKRVRIEYQAGIASSSPMTGYVWVDVVAEPVAVDTAAGQPAAMTGNNVPTPVSVDARVIVGDTVRVPISVYGQDPDGDSVTVAGLRTPPKYGRVVEFGADYLTYESYPDVGNVGMDSFQFYVQDRFGAIGIGTVRVGLSAPHDVPPPLGVDDVVTAQPNVPVTVYPASNDVLPLGSGSTLIVLDGSSTAQVDQESASVVTIAPDVDSPAVSLGYHLDAGGVAGTSAQIMVRSQEGYLNPPNVTDHAAENVEDGMASVDVLEDAWDVDGPDDAIHIVSVGGRGSFDGSTVSVPVVDRGQVVPFVVEDADGAQAMAVVFVPSLTDGRPTLVSGGLIKMDRNGTQQVDLNDYIESPRHEAVHLTLASQAWTAPSAYLDVSVTSDQQVTLRAKNDYVGPAALTVEVRDSPDSTDPGALTGVVTIPVQIGAATPVLWCPEDVVQVVQGGVPISVNVAEVCHAWMPTQAEIDALRYTGSWFVGGDEITITGRDQGPLPSDVLTLQALPQSRPGVESTLLVGVDGYDVTGQLRVQVIAAPRPTMSVSSVTDVQQGTSVEVPVTVTSSMLGAVQNIVSVTQTSGPAGSVTFDERTIQVTPDPASHGLLVFDVVGSDVTDDTRTDRQVTGSFSVEVFGVPDPPSAPQPGTQLRSRSAVVTFVPAADNGAPILGYEVKWDGGSVSCGLNTTCEIPNLVNGTAYRFQVRAINKAGESAWSELGPEVIPNAIPGAVVGLTASTPGCGTVVLAWKPPTSEGTAPTQYHLTWGGADPVAVSGSTTTYTPTGLDNNQSYTFAIVAENEAGMGQQPTTVKGQSSCKPMWSGTQVTVASQDVGDTAQIKVSWPAADPQGPGPVTYQVTRTGPDGTKTFAPTTETTLGDTGDEITYDGQTYSYHVTATNATGGADHTSDQITGSFTAISAPAPWSTVGGAAAVEITATGDNGRMTVSVASFPKFRDSSGEVRVSIGSHTATLTPGAPSASVDGFINGTDLTASFTACNTQNMCNAPQFVTAAGGPFGPLTTPVISAVQGTGRNVCFSASGDGNGRGATLIVTGSNGIGEVYRNTSLSVTNQCVDALAWDTDVTFTAHLETATTSPSRANSADASVPVHSAIGAPDPWTPGSIQVKGTGLNGQLEVTVTEFPASNGGTLRVSYSVVETGASGVIPAPGSVTVSGLNNGQDYSIQLTADNGSNTSVSPAVKGHPYGPLEAPIVTAEPGQDKNACFRVTTPASGTNGEKAKLRIQFGILHPTQWDYDLQVGPIDTGVLCRYVGEYLVQQEVTAQLVTGPDLNRTDSPWAWAEVMTAVGTPEKLSSSNIVWAATGVSGQVRLELTGALPAHNGGPEDHLRVDVVAGGRVYSLTASSPTVTIGELANGTPTSLRFTPCNASQCSDDGAVSVVVTAAGPLGVPELTSGGPVSPTSVDKTVCAQFSADANGADAMLTITNNLNSTTISATGKGILTPATPLCVRASGANAPVVFTATIIDTSTINPQRGPQSTSWTGYSAKDAGPMKIWSYGSQPFEYHGTTAHICVGFQYSTNGADAEVTIWPVSPRSDETWDPQPTYTISGSETPQENDSTPRYICATVPTDGRTVEIATKMTDISGFDRPDATASHPFPVDNVPPMTFVSSSVSYQTQDGLNQVCGVFRVAGGGKTVNLLVYDSLGQGSHTGAGEGEFQVTDCVTAWDMISTTVTFTAELTDPTYGRSDQTQTLPDVQVPGPSQPRCSYKINTPTQATMTYANLPASSQAMFTSNLESRCVWIGEPICLTFTGSGTQVIDWPTGTDITSSFTMRIENAGNIVINCAKE